MMFPSKPISELQQVLSDNLDDINSAIVDLLDNDVAVMSSLNVCTLKKKIILCCYTM